MLSLRCRTTERTTTTMLRIIMLSLRCRTTERTTTTMWTDRDSAATTVLPRLRRPVPWHWKTTSRIRTHTRNCSSTTIPTTWAAAATSPIWTARWFSTSSMCRSAKCSLKSETAFGIRLISSTRRNSTRRRDCITMVRGTMTHISVFGCRRMH